MEFPRRTIRAKKPSVRNRASTLWSEVVRMLNDSGERLECVTEDGVCVYCQSSLATTADHLRPAGAAIRQSHSSYTTPIVPCCASCNCSKGKREFGLWMINKFGFSNQTLLKICDLLGGDSEEDEPQQQEQHQQSHIPQELGITLRNLCYQFCNELHSLVLECKAKPDQWKEIVWKDC